MHITYLFIHNEAALKNKLINNSINDTLKRPNEITLNYVSHHGYTIMDTQDLMIFWNQSLKESLPFGLNEDYMKSCLQSVQHDARNMARG